MFSECFGYSEGFRDSLGKDEGMSLGRLLDAGGAIDSPGGYR